MIAESVGFMFDGIAIHATFLFQSNSIAYDIVSGPTQNKDGGNKREPPMSFWERPIP